MKPTNNKRESAVWLKANLATRFGEMDQRIAHAVERAVANRLANDPTFEVNDVDAFVAEKAAEYRLVVDGCAAGRQCDDVGAVAR